MIIATNLTKKFGNHTVLDNFSVTCNKGECIALIGPNGSGKTTFIKSVLGMVICNSGFITFNGKNIRNDFLYREKIGYMPQIGRYPDNMTVDQLFIMMRNIRGKYTNGIDDELIDLFNLGQLMGKRIQTLSGGTKQKVSAALSFYFNPDALILDEPTAGLDPVSSEIFREKIIKEKGNGKLILITSHVLSELDDLVTQIIYMHEGRLGFHTTLDALKKETGETRLSKAVTTAMLVKK